VREPVLAPVEAINSEICAGVNAPVTALTSASFEPASTGLQMPFTMTMSNAKPQAGIIV